MAEKRQQNQKIKIGIYTEPLKHGPSGPNIYLKNLCEFLLKLQGESIEIYFIHSSRRPHDFYQKNKEIICPRWPILFERCLMKSKLDILHLNWIPHIRPFIFSLPFKKVVTLHGDLSFVLPCFASVKSKIIKNIWKLYFRLGLLDRINFYIAVSTSVAQTFKKELNIPNKKIGVIYPGIAEYFKLRDDSLNKIKRRFGISSPFILNVNNFSPIKNLPTLVKALYLVKKFNPKFSYLKLVIVGKGWENSKIMKQISKYGLQDDVKILGEIKPENLPLLYSAAKVYVNPSLHETFGFSNLEAMACGCPVISSRRFAIPEVVREAAILLDNPADPEELANKILILLKNKKLREELREKGFKQAKKFSWEKCAKETLLVYKRVMNKI